MSSDAAEVTDTEEEEEVKELSLDVKVDSTSSCGRHVTVTVSKDDVVRYFDEAYSELMPSASVPGFRSGRAPRKLVESRYKDEVGDQVKGKVLMDAMTQVTTQSDFAAISEPDFDFDAIDLEPNESLTFEFDIEVRPEFDMPKWKGMSLERPTREFDKKDIDRHLERLLKDMADLVPHDGAAEADDFVMAQITFTHEGNAVSECTEEVRVVPRLSFPDAYCDGFDKLIAGSKTGDKKDTTLTISHDAANEDLRGKDVKAEIEILDVKKLKLPKIDEATLSTLGDFDSEGDLRDAVKSDLERRLGYQQQKRVREQITALLTESAEWDLPKDLLKRQSHRELERAVMELRSAGYGPDEIRAYENELRQNSLESTKRALKEHFILERIAEEEEIEESPEDYEVEIGLIAAQTREPIRRVRARIEKQGLMDALRNQIVERKVIETITSAAKFNEVPYQVEDNQVFAVDHIVSGVKDSVIPVAKHGGDSEQLKDAVDRT